LSGESRPRIRAGDVLTFRGVVRANPADVTELGVSPQEGRTLLARQGIHIVVAPSELTVDRPT
jgi:hypothetical protein